VRRAVVTGGASGSGAAAGDLAPVVGATYPLTEATSLRLVAPTGKVVLVP
jgi:hypothetical protein